MVQVRTVAKKKVFKLTGYVDMSPRLLLEELFYKMEQVPAWNPTLTESRVVQPIDEFTDISYQVSRFGKSVLQRYHIRTNRISTEIQSSQCLLREAFKKKCNICYTRV